MARERSTRRQFLAAAAAASAAGLSGCESGGTEPTPTDSGDGTDAPTDTPTATPTATPTDTATATPTDAPTATPTATPTPADWAQWPTFQRNAANWGHNPDASGPHDEVSVRWKRDLDGTQVNSSPILADGTLFVGDGGPGDDQGTFYALDPETGETIWSKTMDAPLHGGACYANGFVYAGNGAGAVYALDAEDGSELWDFDLNSDETFTPPTVVDGHVYVGANSGRLYKLDALNGEHQWNFRTAGAITGAPVYDDGTIVVSSEDGSIYGVSDDNEEEWTEGFDGTANGVAMRDGFYFGTGSDGRVVQVNERGNDTWSFYTNDDLPAIPAVTTDALFVGTRGNAVLAVDRRRGYDRWRFDGPEDQVTAAPVVADGTVYVGCRDNRVYAVDTETGEQEWSFETDGPIYESTPVVADGTVFIGSRDGRFYALAE